MIEGWNEYNIKDICQIIGGFAFKSKDFKSEGDVPIIKIKSLKDKKIVISGGEFVDDVFLELNEKYHINFNDYIIALTGSHITLPSSAVGRVSKSTHKRTLLLNQRVGKFKVNPELCSHDFLYHFLTTDYFFQNIGLRAKGAANQANVSTGDVGSIKINLPPLPTQQKIAKILSAYDDLIENNLKRIKLLEEMAQKTYEEWFVFRKIDNELIDDSQIDFQNLEELIADYMNGGWGKEIEVGNYTVPAFVIRGTDMPDISSGSFDKLPLRFHTTSNFKSRELQNGDIIIEMSNGNINNVGRSFYYDRDFNKLIEYPAMCASFCKMLRPKNVELSYIVNSHIKYIYNTNRMLVYKSQAANGINNFRFEDMISDEILSIPKGDLLNKLVATLKPKYELISNVRNQIKLLKEARDILLPRLMTGMIDVDKIETEL